MKNLPTQKSNGLYQRYQIKKITGWKPDGFTGQKPVLRNIYKGSEYFVMRLDTGGSDPEHIKACRIGVHAYADAIQHHLPELAKDLKERYPLL